MSDVNVSEYEVGAWIKATLDAAETGMETFLDVIPTEAAMPAVRMTCQSRNDVRTNAQHIALSTFRFLVVVAAFAHELETTVVLSKRIDAALHRASGAATGITVLACTRIQTYSNTSPEQGGLYRLGGAIYEIVAQGS